MNHKIARMLIIVITSQATDLFKAPEFAEMVPNITVTEGMDATLPCVVNNLGKNKVAWVHVEKKQVLTVHKNLITRNYRITLDHRDHRHWILNINKVQETDRGHYMCQINTNPMKQQTGYLQVVVPPRFDEFRTVSEAVALEGSDVTLRCHASGYPEPSIQWSREDGSKIPVTDTKGHKQLLDEVEGETLYIKRVSRLHMGAFLCIAHNGIPPSVSHRVLLQVNFTPMLWIPNQLIGARLQETAILECHGEAYPKSINYWTNSTGDMIMSDDHFESTMTDSHPYKTTMILRIIRVRKSDFGTYRCISKNPLGDTEGHVTLYEKENVDPYYNPSSNRPSIDRQNIIVVDKEIGNGAEDTSLEDRRRNKLNTKPLKNERKEGKSLPTRTDLSKIGNGSERSRRSFTILVLVLALLRTC